MKIKKLCILIIAMLITSTMLLAGCKSNKETDTSSETDIAEETTAERPEKETTVKVEEKETVTLLQVDKEGLPKEIKETDLIYDSKTDTYYVDVELLFKAASKAGNEGQVTVTDASGQKITITEDGQIISENNSVIVRNIEVIKGDKPNGDIISMYKDNLINDEDISREQKEPVSEPEKDTEGQTEEQNETTAARNEAKDNNEQRQGTATEATIVHFHSYVDELVTPTYNAEEYTLHICSVCGDSYKDTFVPKLEFETKTVSQDEWGEWFVSTEASCTKHGVMMRTSKYGQIEYENIPATGHEYDDGVVVKESDCRNNGIKRYTCSKCGETMEESLPFGEHKYEETIIHHDAVTKTIHHDDVYEEDIVPGEVEYIWVEPNVDEVEEHFEKIIKSPDHIDMVLKVPAYDEEVIVEEAYDETCYKCAVCGIEKEH